MYVSYKQLVSMMETAFGSGQVCSLDSRDQVVEEIIQENKLGPERDLRVYAVDELRHMPAGTVFQHSLLGRGEIVTKRGVRQPFMKFDNGVTHAFAADTFPWDLPMVLVSEPGK